jgi:hypothetical protein
MGKKDHFYMVKDAYGDHLEIIKSCWMQSRGQWHI